MSLVLWWHLRDTPTDTLVSDNVLCFAKNQINSIPPSYSVYIYIDHHVNLYSVYRAKRRPEEAVWVRVHVHSVYALRSRA